MWKRVTQKKMFGKMGKYANIERDNQICNSNFLNQLSERAMKARYMTQHYISAPGIDEGSSCSLDCINMSTKGFQILDKNISESDQGNKLLTKDIHSFRVISYGVENNRNILF